MAEFFSAIGTAVSTAFNLVLTAITSVLRFLQMTFQFVGYLTEVVAFLPPMLVPFILVGVSLSVILLILSRQG